MYSVDSSRSAVATGSSGMPESLSCVQVHSNAQSCCQAFNGRAADANHRARLVVYRPDCGSAGMLGGSAELTIVPGETDSRVQGELGKRNYRGALTTGFGGRRGLPPIFPRKRRGLTRRFTALHFAQSLSAPGSPKSLPGSVTHKIIIRRS